MKKEQLHESVFPATPPYRAESPKRTAVVLDTDVGTDDALAILLSRFLPGVPIDYIIASEGNTTLEGAVRNAIVLKHYLGLDAEVVRGISPKADENVNAQEKNTFHGSDGLGGIRADMIERLGLSNEQLGKSLPYEEFRRRLLSYDTILPLVIGPATNLANALDDPECKKKLSEAYIMGGGINEFNCSHDTEFNFSKDPTSVKKILESGLTVTLFPLDLTNHQRVSEKQIDSLEKTGAFEDYISMLRYNLKSNREYNDIDAAVLHDTMPVFYLAYPEKFTVRERKITVDRYGATKPDKNGTPVRIVTGVEEDLLNHTLTDIFTGA